MTVTPLLLFFCDKKSIITIGHTKILNHSREWDGKPTGSLRDSRVAEMPNRYEGPGFFISKKTEATMIKEKRNDTFSLSTQQNHASCDYSHVNIVAFLR